jgi:hypothetical protein
MLSYIPMLPSFVEVIIDLVESVLSYAPGSSIFNLVLGVCVFAWVIAARIFMGLFSSRRGLLAAFLALLVTLSVGLIAYGLIEVYVVPSLELARAGALLPSVGFWLFVFLATQTLGRRILDLSTGVTVFIYLVATAAAIGAYWGAQVTMGLIEYGEGQVEQREQRVNEGIETLLERLP